MNNTVNHIFDVIDDLLKQKDHIIIVIDGMACSGKTTLANILLEKYESRVVHMDHFFLPKELRTEDRFSLPGGNVHFERFNEEVIPTLRSDIKYRHFNCSLMDYDEIIELPLKTVTIVEGTYSDHPVFGKYYDLLIYLGIKKEEQLDRIMKRDGEFLLNKFINEWLKYESLYFNEYQTEEKANIILKDFGINE